MNLSVKNLSLVFAAGLFGGLVNCLLVWLFGRGGIPQALGVQIASALNTTFIYPELVWGGLWGLLFLIPLDRLSFPIRGLLISLLASMFQLFWGVSLHSPQRHFGSPIGGVDASGRVDLYRPVGNSCWFLVAVGAARLCSDARLGFLKP